MSGGPVFPGHQAITIESAGRGIWYNIHKLALKMPANIYCYVLRTIINNLPCAECISDAQVYLNSNPPENWENPFVGSVRFHNYVNNRLGKPIMDVADAFQLYSDEAVCQRECSIQKNGNPYGYPMSKLRNY